MKYYENIIFQHTKMIANKLNGVATLNAASFMEEEIQENLDEYRRIWYRCKEEMIHKQLEQCSVIDKILHNNHLDMLRIEMYLDGLYELEEGEVLNWEMFGKCARISRSAYTPGKKLYYDTILEI